MRQATLLDKRQKEIASCRMDVNSLQNKLAERERVHIQNRDLVTKNCGQQSQIDNLKRQMLQMTSKMEEMQTEKDKQVRHYSNKPTNYIQPKQAPYMIHQNKDKPSERRSVQ